MKRNIVLIMIITLFTKFLGFGREMALTYFYGVSATSDVYLIAQTIPNTIFALVGTGLATTFIPIYNKVRKEKGEDRANHFTSNVMTITVIITVIIIALVQLFTPQVVMLFASGFRGEKTMEMAVAFTRISVFGITLSGLIYIMNAYLQLKGNFIIPAMISLPMNLVVIFSFYLAYNTSDIILAYGIVASILIQLIFILPSVIRNRLKYKFVLNLKDVYLKEMLILSIPVVIGTSVNQLNVIVDRSIASNVVVGGISALSYANMLNILIHGLFVAPIVTVIYPNISNKVISKDFMGLQRTINNSIVYISLLVIPATVGIMVLARPIIELLFLRGEFDAVAAAMTAQALFYYSIGMYSSSLRQIFSRVFYSYKDTKTPTINAMIGVTINIILNLILSRFMGIGGLALATSISATVTTYLLIRSLRRKVTHFGLKPTVTKVLGVLFASSVMGAVSYLLFYGTDFGLGSNLTLVLTIVVSSTIYVMLILLFKIDEVEHMITMVKNALLRK